MGDVISKALGNTVIGIGTVFLVLIIIMAVIFAFKLFPVIEKKMADKAARKASAGQSQTAPAPAPAAAAGAASEDVPIAAIIAAIQAYNESQGITDYDGFIVRSIKRRF